MMVLEDSCHCGAVRFSLESEHPYPFNLCYCSICRKTAGGGGFAINPGGRFAWIKAHAPDAGLEGFMGRSRGRARRPEVRRIS
jgi:hypothetical protein